MKQGAQASVLGLVALAYVIWRPVSNGQILYPVLAIIAALSAIDVLLSPRRERRRIPASLGVVWLLLAVAVMLGAAVGSFRDAPGLSHQLTLWLGGLVIWGLWAWAIDLATVRRVVTTIMVATGLLSLLIVLYIGANAGYLPSVIPAGLLEMQAAGFDGTGDGTAIRLYGLSSLAIAAPMAAAGGMLPASRYLPSKRLMVVVAVLAVLAAFMAGRRAISVVTLVTPLLVWVVQMVVARRRDAKGRRAHIPVAVPILAPFAALAAWWFAQTAIAAQVWDAVRDAALLVGIIPGDVSLLDRSRGAQATELLQGWGQHPILGAGLGAELESGFTRSDERSWSFELQYHLMLFNLGLVGVLLVVAAAVIAVLAVRRAAAARPDVAPLLVMTSVGALAVIVANATNPYLQAVGHQWGVALALGVACAVLRGAPTQEARASAPRQSWYV